MLDTALDYLNRGWSVIPLRPQDKVPHFALLPTDGAGTRTWKYFQDRLPLESEVAHWWRTEPAANIGIVTGHVSGIIVQDLDGPAGMSQAQRHGGVPVTPTSRTGNGLHVVYRHPGYEVRNFAGRAPGVDLRGDGGYIVAPPSIHPNGSQYQWQVDPDTTLADPPDWFAELFHADPAARWLEQTLSAELRAQLPVTSANYWHRALVSEIDRLARATHGMRNNTLVKAAYRMGQVIGAGHLSEEEVEHALFLTAQAIGLGTGEIRRTIRSGLSAGMLNPRR